jgi:putative alpha-1,2-mannosidase
LTVLALNQGPANVYVQAVSFNGVPIENRVSVSYDELRQGGELRFEMGPEPASATASSAA